MLVFAFQGLPFWYQKSSQKHVFSRRLPGHPCLWFYIVFMWKWSIWGSVQNPGRQNRTQNRPSGAKRLEEIISWCHFSRRVKHLSIKKRRVDWTFVLFMLFVVLHFLVLAVSWLRKICFYNFCDRAENVENHLADWPFQIQRPPKSADTSRCQVCQTNECWSQAKMTKPELKGASWILKRSPLGRQNRKFSINILVFWDVFASSNIHPKTELAKIHQQFKRPELGRQRLQFWCLFGTIWTSIFD